MRLKDLAVLFLLAAIWGASFLFMRIAAPVIGPFLTIELRVLIAGIALLVYAVLAKKKPQLKSMWKQYLFIGTLNAAIPFTLIATATMTLNASMASILNSTTPLFGVLVAWIWLKEKITVKKIFGIILGIIGVVILLGWSPVPYSFKVIAAASFSILAAICYAISTVYVKLNFKGVDPLTLSIGQQLAAALVLMPITLVRLPSVPVSGHVVFAVLGLALICTAFAYILYFRLLSSVGPTKTLSVTIIVPLFGVLWGILFLGEKLTLGVLAGLIVILSSVYLMTDVKFR